jgi:hypothetical protein
MVAVQGCEDRGDRALDLDGKVWVEGSLLRCCEWEGVSCVPMHCTSRVPAKGVTTMQIFYYYNKYLRYKKITVAADTSATCALVVAILQISLLTKRKKIFMFVVPAMG